MNISRTIWAIRNPRKFRDWIWMHTGARWLCRLFGHLPYAKGGIRERGSHMFYRDGRMFCDRCGEVFREK